MRPFVRLFGRRGGLPPLTCASEKLDVDAALDEEHSKEADAALRKWREAAGALPAPVRPRPKQQKLKIDIDRKAASHVVFGGDDDDDEVYADDSSSGGSSESGG